MRDLLRRLIDSLSELTHWLGDREERQLSLSAVVSEVQAVARALERTSDRAELQGLARRLHIVAAAAESEMKRTVHDLDQARHAAFRATVLAAELTIRSVRNEAVAALPAEAIAEGTEGGTRGIAGGGDPGTPSGADHRPGSLRAEAPWDRAVTPAPSDSAGSCPVVTEQSAPPADAPRAATARPRGIRWLLGGRPEAVAG